MTSWRDPRPEDMKPPRMVEKDIFTPKSTNTLANLSVLFVFVLLLIILFLLIRNSENIRNQGANIADLRGKLDNQKMNLIRELQGTIKAEVYDGVNKRLREMNEELKHRIDELESRVYKLESQKKDLERANKEARDGQIYDNKTKK